jgi:hypothetical protein
MNLMSTPGRTKAKVSCGEKESRGRERGVEYDKSISCDPSPTYHGLILKKTWNQPGVMVHIYNASTWEANEGRL